MPGGIAAESAGPTPQHHSGSDLASKRPTDHHVCRLDALVAVCKRVSDQNPARRSFINDVHRSSHFYTSFKEHRLAYNLLHVKWAHRQDAEGRHSNYARGVSQCAIVEDCEAFVKPSRLSLHSALCYTDDSKISPQ